MYSSLDKLDLVVDEGTRKVAIQTDHRSPDEIEESWDLSVVFAALRARNALVCGHVQGVRFAYMQAPPDRMAAFARRCGAEVEVGVGGEVLPATPDPDGVLTEVEDAWLREGARLFSERGLTPDLDGLRQIEAALRADGEGGPDSEFSVQYWTNVLRLGGAAALVMKERFGGKLHGDDGVASGISFRWAHGDGTLTNLFVRAASFLDDDPGVAPSDLVRMTAEHAAGGDVMLNLRPPGWEGVSMALTVPLMPNVEKLDGVKLPVVAIVIDLPTATKTLPKETPAEEAARLREQAIANNRKLEVRIDTIDAAGTPLLAVHGHYYAAERLFDREFMSSLGARLDAKLLMASVPRKGLLLVQSAVTEPERVGAFLNIARGQFERANPSDRLSTEILLLTDGDVSGMVRVETKPVEALAETGPAKANPPVASTPASGTTPREEAAPPKKKGFWSRLFGGGGEA